MFYATKIKKVAGDKAIDEQGKVLSFVGYMPVEVGDTVITDGTIIFGCAKVKGSYNTFAETPSGIPVLAKNTRGYFKLNGKYTQTYVAGENWLVNAKRTFAHDTAAGEIIDAEIARNDSGKENGVYTVEKINTHFKGDDTQSDYVLLENDIARDCELIIRKGAEEKERVKLSTLSKRVEDIAAAYVKIVEVARQRPLDKVTSSATIKNFKIMPDGSWQLLVDYAIFAVRQFSRINTALNFDTTKRETYNKGTFPDNFPWGGDRAAIASAFRDMGFSEVTTDIVLRDSALGQSFFKAFYDLMRPSYTESLIEYGTASAVEVSEEETGNIYNTTANCDFLICFYSDGYFKKVYEETYCTPLIMNVTNYEGFINGKPIPNSEHIEATRDKKAYPYIDYHLTHKKRVGGYHWEFIIWTFYGIAIKDRFVEDAVVYCNVECTGLRYDSRNLPNAPLYNQRFYFADDNFFFPIQDGYSVKLKPIYSPTFYLGDRYICYFNGIFDEVRKPVVADIFPTINNAHEWHTSLVPLRKGTFLFGVHGDNLYELTTTGGFTQLDAGLKNFRLRELQNINKAKK